MSVWQLKGLLPTSGLQLHHRESGAVMSAVSVTRLFKFAKATSPEIISSVSNYYAAAATSSSTDRRSFGISTTMRSEHGEDKSTEKSEKVEEIQLVDCLDSCIDIGNQKIIFIPICLVIIIIIVMVCIYSRHFF